MMFIDATAAKKLQEWAEHSEEGARQLLKKVGQCPDCERNHRSPGADAVFLLVHTLEVVASAAEWIANGESNVEETGLEDSMEAVFRAAALTELLTDEEVGHFVPRPPVVFDDMIDNESQGAIH